MVTDIQRLSYLAYLDCPGETHEDLALQNFIDSVWDLETQKVLRLANLKDIASALDYIHKIEAAQQASRKDRHMIRAVSTTNLKTNYSKQTEDLQKEIGSLKEHKSDRNRRIQRWDCSEDGHL